MVFAKLFMNLNFSPFPIPFSPIYSPLRNAPNGHAYHKGVEVYDKGYKNTAQILSYILYKKSLLELSLTSLFELIYHITSVFFVFWTLNQIKFLA